MLTTKIPGFIRAFKGSNGQRLARTEKGAVDHEAVRLLAKSMAFFSAAIVSPNHSAWKYLKKMVDRTVFCPYSEKVVPEFRTVDVQIEGEWKTVCTPAPLSIRVIRRPVQSIPSRSLPTVVTSWRIRSRSTPNGETPPRGSDHPGRDL